MVEALSLGIIGQAHIVEEVKCPPGMIQIYKVGFKKRNVQRKSTQLERQGQDLKAFRFFFFSGMGASIIASWGRFAG